ncbi:MAG: glycosyltransferase family 4 protein [Actinomycetota bacterium]
MSTIHQFVPSFTARDAIGSHVVQIQRALRERGHRSDIFDAASYRRFKPEGDETVLLFHLSVGSEIAEVMLERPEPLVVNYHNITPALFFRRWDRQRAHAAEQGRRQLARLAPRTTLAIADSAFNQGELREAGYGTTCVVPILVDLRAFDREPDAATLQRLQAARRAGGAQLLFVGRITANKAQHDVLRAFAWYREVHDPKARLHLVGWTSPGAYISALRDAVAELGLEAAVDLPGSVTPEELIAYYRTADVFVCLSDHEGFCVPLLEAMHHRVPIVAYAAGAVPDTVADAAVVIDDKRPALVAEAIHAVMADETVRTALVDAGQARLADFELSQTAGRFSEAVESVLGRRR